MQDHSMLAQICSGGCCPGPFKGGGAARAPKVVKGWAQRIKGSITRTRDIERDEASQRDIQGTSREASGQGRAFEKSGDTERDQMGMVWSLGGPGPGIPRVLGVPERMASLAGQKEKGCIWGLKGRQGRARLKVLRRNSPKPRMAT